MTLQTTDYDYNLPSHLIAQYPLPIRSQSRLLQLNLEDKSINHLNFNRLVDILNEKDLVIFNDTKVIPARLYGTKSTGGKVECLVERLLSSHQALVQIRASKAPQAGTIIHLAEAFDVKVLSREGDLFKLQSMSREPLLSLLQVYGKIPLPPYIQRVPEGVDDDRYQTIFAKQEGAVAAPTAGLHFDEPIMQALDKNGIQKAYITLHVGAGTFQPVRTDAIKDHQMHSEIINVSHEICDAINCCKRRGGRVIAVGTTVVRSLESASQSGAIQPFRGETSLFIYPGYRFHTVDALITNFHLPRSSLLMLVSAFGGHELVMNAYREAIKKQYRFFSYGDAMIII